VTGAAGFIGSRLSAVLAEAAWDVRGVDAFTPYYDPSAKRHQATALHELGVDVTERDLMGGPLDDLVEGVDVVFHFAAQPGVRHSWDDFDTYLTNNVAATQSLLEAAQRRPTPPRVVFASSSSVYGQTDGSVNEDSPTRPYSPYGVTKLAAEHLCSAYAQNFGLPTVSLRLFTVYGPGQRPDMAFHKLIRAALAGVPFPVYGDGSQVRAFTYVDDVVDAAVRAATTALDPGTVLNISGGSTCTLRSVFDVVEQATGTPVDVHYSATQAGDVRSTDADISRARSVIGWQPAVSLADGLARQVDQMRRTNLVSGQVPEIAAS
jgi:nucleoside-diphosphate-sugar epimerase